MTYYDILQVSENASEEVIRMAYKALAKKYHPDVFEGVPKMAEQKMKEINEAYEVLSDNQKRAEYDALINKKQNDNSTTKKGNSKKKKTPFIIVTAFIIVSIVIASLAMILVNKKDDSDKSNKTNTTVGVRTITFEDKNTAEEVLTKWRNGAANEESMIELMNEYGESQGGGKLHIITRGVFIEEIDQWCFSTDRKIGDFAIIESEYGYSICYISSFNEPANSDTEISHDYDYKALGVTYEQYKIATIIANNSKKYCEYIYSLKSVLSKGTYDENLKIEKATDYINNLPMAYGQKIILFKIQFPEDNTYNNDIIEYLNESDDITYEETVYILEELGFAVFEDGTVKW